MMRSRTRLIRSVVTAFSLVLLSVFPTLSGYAEEGGPGEPEKDMEHHHEVFCPT